MFLVGGRKLDFEGEAKVAERVPTRLAPFDVGVEMTARPVLSMSSLKPSTTIVRGRLAAGDVRR